MDKNNKNPLDWASSVLEAEILPEEIVVDLNDEHFLDHYSPEFLDILHDFTQNE